MADVYDEFLLPVPTLFVIFTACFVLAKNVVRNNLFFLGLFLLSCFFSSSIQAETKAVVGFMALLLLAACYFKSMENKVLILYMGLVFLYYSPLAVKFPRYVMAALPAVYLLVGELVYDVRKYRVYLITAVAVLAFFIAFNSLDTVNKLVIDDAINDVKFEAQKYVIDSSKECSSVISKTWYSLYYLRLRVSDLPGDLAGLSTAIKSSCSCPPEYVFSEGGWYPAYLEGLITKEREFSKVYSITRIDFSGIKREEGVISPVVVYRIDEDFVRKLCY
jgi:hypothetical protein